MTVYLVRHAVAVGRGSWSGDDTLRPLTAKGERQSQALLRLFGDTDVRRILSSPAVRCRTTVDPLAAHHHLDVRSTPALGEGRSAKGAYELLRAQAGKRGDSVLCLHGDLIPELLRKLRHEGVRLESEVQFAKGSTWELPVKDGAFATGRYHPPAE